MSKLSPSPKAATRLPQMSSPGRQRQVDIDRTKSEMQGFPIGRDSPQMSNQRRRRDSEEEEDLEIFGLSDSKPGKR